MSDWTVQRFGICLEFVLILSLNSSFSDFTVDATLQMDYSVLRLSSSTPLMTFD